MTTGVRELWMHPSVERALRRARTPVGMDIFQVCHDHRVLELLIRVSNSAVALAVAMDGYRVVLDESLEVGQWQLRNSDGVIAAGGRYR